MLREIGLQQQMQDTLNPQQEPIAKALFDSKEFQTAISSHPDMENGFKLFANGIASKYDPATHTSVASFFSTEVPKYLEILTKDYPGTTRIPEITKELKKLGVDETNAGILADSNPSYFPTLSTTDFTDDIPAASATGSTGKTAQDITIPRDYADRLVGTAMADLSTTFNQYINEKGGLAGNIFGGGKKKKARENLQKYNEYITTDIKKGLDELYSTNPDTTAEEVETYLHSKFDRFKDAASFTTYVTEVINRDGTQEEKDKLSKSDFKEQIDEFYENKGRAKQVTATISAPFTILDQKVEYETKKAAGDQNAVDPLAQYEQQTKKKVEDELKERGEGGGFMNILKGLAEQFPALQWLVQLLEGFFGDKKDKGTTQTQTNTGTTDNTVTPSLQQAQVPDMGQVLTLSGTDPSKFNLGWSSSSASVGNTGQLSASTAANGAALYTNPATVVKK